MFDFKALGRWRPDTLIAAADYLEAGGTIKHLGHLYDVEVVVEAFRHSAEQLRQVRIRAYEAAGMIFARGWEFREHGGSVMVRESVATGDAYNADLDEVEDLMADYATDLADALIDAHTIALKLSAVVEAAHRDPNERARVRPRRSLRPVAGSRARRDRHRLGRRGYGCHGRGPA